MSTPADPRLVHGLLRLYPAGWRARYADEFAAVLTATMADRRSRRQRWRVAADVAAGAADAHLHPGASAAPASRPDRIRNAACLAFCAFALFCLAGSGFQKMSEDPAFTAAARAHARIGWSYDIVLYGAIVAALAVGLASLPVLLAIVRQARAGRPGLVKLLLVPPLATAAWLALAVGVTRLDPGGVHSAVNVVAFVGIVLAAHVAAAVSAAALVVATRRAELPAPVKRSAWMPMTVLSAAMVAVTAGDLVWGLSLPPGLYDSHNGVLATPLPVTWIGTLAVMAATSAVAIAATAHAIRLAQGTDHVGAPPPEQLSQPG